MPDDSIHCILGRLEQKLAFLQEDIQELKNEQKEIKNYVTNQRIGANVLITILVSIGTMFTLFKDEILGIVFGTVTKVS